MPGDTRITNDTLINDSGEPDPYVPDAQQFPVQTLPEETLVYLLGSRYCETDILANEAWRLFGNGPTGWQRVQAVCDFVHNSVRFSYLDARATRTAAETLHEGIGVCRDFAHLAVALCRALNIPTRYCTGYISDLGMPLPYDDQDFAAWMEVYLDGRWWTFDPRNNTRRAGRVLIAQGRDAADVPLTHTFGQHELAEFKVWVNQLD
jgi:transglutaminase-like putative cysteine protease